MLVNLWVKDTQSGEIHQIGTDPHDSLGLFEGNVHYVNMQNMSGTLGGDYTFVDAPDSDAYISVTPEELMLNRELVHNDLVKAIKERHSEKETLEDYYNSIRYMYQELNKIIFNDNDADCNFAFMSILKCNSFWFKSGYNVASIFYKGYTMHIDVAGEVNGSYCVNEDEDVGFDIQQLYTSGDSPIAAYDPGVEAYIKSDYDLKKFEEEGSLVLENNNWLNAVIMHDESNSRYKDSSFPVGDNIIEALLTYVEDFFKYVDECIAQGVIWAEGAPNWMN